MMCLILISSLFYWAFSSTLYSLHNNNNSPSTMKPRTALLYITALIANFFLGHVSSACGY
ncbi:hypothetical protein F4819DRAFT_464593, partial [Hypoxylon fuscum]